MRFRPDVRALALCFALGLVAGVAWPATAAADLPTNQEIERAVDAVKADPNLATQRTLRTLKWEDGDAKKRKRDTPGWLRWIAELFGWLGQGARGLLWIGLAVLAALLVVFVVRMVRSHRGNPRAARFTAPTHVQDLDIRPESLPPDIGAAARTLWDRGEQRAALALLYRGLLSRLAHVHEIAIRDSSTEGDCLALAARTLDGTRTAYVTGLIRTWQRATYGGLAIGSPEIHALCSGFAPNLDAAQTAAVPGTLAGQRA